MPTERLPGVEIYRASDELEKQAQKAIMVQVGGILQRLEKGSA